MAVRSWYRFFAVLHLWPVFGSVEMKLQSGKWYSTLYKLHPFLNSGKQWVQEMESCCELFVGTDLVIGLTKCEYSIITKPGELERRAGADRSDLSDRNAASLYTLLAEPQTSPVLIMRRYQWINSARTSSIQQINRHVLPWPRFHQSLPRKCNSCPFIFGDRDELCWHCIYVP